MNVVNCVIAVASLANLALQYSGGTVYLFGGWREGTGGGGGGSWGAQVGSKVLHGLIAVAS